eukprot:Nitzschia sp. Nitz4//scaffold267_size26297//16293//17471//NITZ4_008270-RA/size26297-processed-gene-0.30-mRNA-1//-1//CDS//3329544908//1633//frame0
MKDEEQSASIARGEDDEEEFPNTGTSSTIVVKEEDRVEMVSDRTQQPSDDDILLGRGKPYQNHPGNRRMLKIIDKFRRQYTTARREARRAIAQHVVDVIEEDGKARFLRRVAEDEMLWEPVEREVAIAKVCHALRSKKLAPTPKKMMALAPGTSSAVSGGGSTTPSTTTTPPQQRPLFPQQQSEQLNLLSGMGMFSQAQGQLGNQSQGSRTNMLLDFVSRSRLPPMQGFSDGSHFNSLKNFLGSQATQSPTAGRFGVFGSGDPTRLPLNNNGTACPSTSSSTMNIDLLLAARQQQQQQEQQHIQNLMFGANNLGNPMVEPPFLAGDSTSGGLKALLAGVQQPHHNFRMYNNTPGSMLPSQKDPRGSGFF